MHNTVSPPATSAESVVSKHHNNHHQARQSNSSSSNSKHLTSPWHSYQTSLNDLFQKPNSTNGNINGLVNIVDTTNSAGNSTNNSSSRSNSSSNSNSPTISSISHLATTNSYHGKMTNSGQRSQTASRDNCTNSLSNICEQSTPVSHEISNQFGSTNSPLVSHSESESPVDLHLYPFGSNPSLVSHSNKICPHRNFYSKCVTCNPAYSSFLRSVGKSLSPSTAEAHYQGFTTSYSQLELSNKMNSLNPEVLMSPEAKHLFSSSSGGVGIGGMGHLGHISTSIAGIPSGVNPGLAGMAGSHLHPSHHHSSHPASIHSMASSGFSLHSHLTAATTGQRRLSSNNSSPTNRSTKNSSNNKQFLCPMCNKKKKKKGIYI